MLQKRDLDAIWPDEKQKKPIFAVALLAIVGLSVFAKFSINSSIWNIQPASERGKELQAYLYGTAGAQIVESRRTSFVQVEIFASASTKSLEEYWRKESD